ncbi:MAG: hypothetical protein ACJ77B_04230, partial [Chloroflexota bacterium]
DEALAAARGESDREATSEQLDAFHKTFNFCMECRQYTCSNCWNDTAGKCLTCAPAVGRSEIGLAFPQLSGLGAPVPQAAPPQEWPKVDVAPSAWPTADLKRKPEPSATPSLVSRLEAAAAPLEPEPAEPEPVEELQAVEAEAPVADEAAAETAPDELAWPAAALVGRQPVDADLAWPVPAEDDAPEHEPAQADAAPEADADRDLHAIDPRLAALRSFMDAEPDAVPEAEDAAFEAESPVELAAVVADEDDADVQANPAGDTDTDPHILARLASIAAPPDLRGARGAGMPRAEPVTPDLSSRVGRPGKPTFPPATQRGTDDERAAATGRSSELIGRFRPGQSLDAALDAFESALAPEASTAPDPAVAAAAAPEVPSLRVVEPEPEVAEAGASAAAEEDLAAQAEEPWFQPAEAAPAAEEPAPAPRRTREPEMIGLEAPARPIDTPPAPPRDDRVELPTWRITPPDQAPQPGPARRRQAPESSVPAAASHQPVPPAEPRWPGQPTTDSLAFLASRSTRDGADAIWAASSRDVLAPQAQGTVPPAAIQSCVSCGLSLSATARFCRRCGTRQGE